MLFFSKIKRHLSQVEARCPFRRSKFKSSTLWFPAITRPVRTFLVAAFWKCPNLISFIFGRYCIPHPQRMWAGIGKAVTERHVKTIDEAARIILSNDPLWHLKVSNGIANFLELTWSVCVMQNRPFLPFRCCDLSFMSCQLKPVAVQPVPVSMTIHKKFGGNVYGG